MPKWLIGVLGCGGLLGLAIVALLVVLIVSGPPTDTAQTEKQTEKQEKGEEQKKPTPAAKKKSGPETVEVSLQQLALLLTHIRIIGAYPLVRRPA